MGGPVALSRFLRRDPQGNISKHLSQSVKGDNVTENCEIVMGALTVLKAEHDRVPSRPLIAAMVNCISWFSTQRRESSDKDLYEHEFEIQGKTTTIEDFVRHT